MQKRREIFRELLSKDNVMILTHKSPDGDTLGTAFALCRVYALQGKKATVVCSDRIPVPYRFLAGGKTMLEADFAPDCIVSVDVADAKLLGDALSDYADRVDYGIDHHPSNTGYAKKTIVNPAASSAGELLFDLLKEAEVSFDRETAVCLYTAVTSDTGCFKFANVTPHTHQVAAELLQYGFETEPINRRLFDISSLEQLKIEADVISRIECYRNHAVTVATLPFSLLENAGEDLEFGGLSSIPRRIEGTVVGISMREYEKDAVKVSLRSMDDRIDVSAIAAVFGGGGHKRASGCVFLCPLEEAKKRLLDEVFRHYDRIFGGRE